MLQEKILMRKIKNRGKKKLKVLSSKEQGKLNLIQFNFDLNHVNLYKFIHSIRLLFANFYRLFF